MSSMATAVLLLCDARFDRSKVRTRGWITTEQLTDGLRSRQLFLDRHVRPGLIRSRRPIPVRRRVRGL
jgi:hypothetical protein